MKQNDKISLLLDFQEHPENYTDEELKRLLEDEQMATLWQRLATSKRAMTDVPEPDVDAEWQRFEQEHFGNRRENRWLKAVAIFVGVLMLSAFTYAAIHAVRHMAIDKTRETTEEVLTTPKDESTDVEPRLGMSDTTAAMPEPVTYDNVPLEEILDGIASRYGMQVEFRNEDARNLRFYFVLNSEEELEAVVERLNMFERVNLSMEGRKIVVE